MSTTTTTAFDLDRLTEAIVARDAPTQLELYAPGATVKIIDRIAQPGAPKLLKSRDAIAAWIEDTAGREMTHNVTHKVADERGAAFVLECRYPDGTNVVCATALEIVNGLITLQTVVQAWDEEA
jgi:hypothetical protein